MKLYRHKRPEGTVEAEQRTEGFTINGSPFPLGSYVVNTNGEFNGMPEADFNAKFEPFRAPRKQAVRRTPKKKALVATPAGIND